MEYPPFSAMADVYDEIMADVDYDGWCDFILRTAVARGYGGGPLLELGCGTGNLTVRLRSEGVAVTGLDASARMLDVARRKAPEIEWRRGEFTSFDLERRFDLVVSVFDSLNNLLSPEQFLAAARQVHRHLVPGGLLLFDVNTKEGLRDLWEGACVEGWAGAVYYRWTHGYDEQTNLARVEAYWERDGRGFREVHFERPFDPEEMEQLLARCGYVDVEFMAFPDGGPVEADAERVWVCARSAAVA